MQAVQKGRVAHAQKHHPAPADAGDEMALCRYMVMRSWQKAKQVPSAWQRREPAVGKPALQLKASCYEANQTPPLPLGRLLVMRTPSRPN